MKPDETEPVPGEDAPEDAPEAPAEPTVAPSPAEPSTAPTAPSEPPQAPDSVTLRLVGPATATRMTFPQADGGSMVVTREGLAVPAEDADSLIQIAAKHGVRLTKASEQ